jgi:hypothetical protein
MQLASLVYKLATRNGVARRSVNRLSRKLDQLA